MKQLKVLALITLNALLFMACQKEKTSSMMEEELNVSSGKKNITGNVYTLTNQASGNSVLEFHRAADGMLTFNTSYPTGGSGSGSGLGNQGGLIIAGEKDVLLAVNAGSNSISSFQITGNGLNLRSTVSSGGVLPVSLTNHGAQVIVLNAGGAGNISGFTLDDAGMLHPVANSTRPLSSANAGAAQIGFTNNGKALAITEKNTNIITSYTVNGSGIPGAMHTRTSANPTPFGFAIGVQGNIFVSEAAGSAPGGSTLSSYNIGQDGMITLVEGPVGANQTAACWVVITNNGKYAFTTNTGDNTLTTFNISKSSGSISVQEAISATTPAGPIDAALSSNSKFLYVLTSGGNSISAFAVANDGGLTSLQTITGLPAGANGLAAR